ncbi:MAG TPA: rod shape-determining protein MreD [Alloprevotella sp.]|nr:rod shape-determining protein MreD [Alloprevotella sp.]
MIQTFFSRTGWFLLLLLLQVLVFNHIHIMGYATPMPYVYFLLLLPSNTPRCGYLLLGFLLGLTVDLFTNTPGIAAASLCFVALLTPPLLRAFSPNDQDDEVLVPSAHSMEWGPFLRLILVTVSIHCALFFSIEAFSFFNPESLLVNIGSSTLLTTLFIVAMELIRGCGKH